MQCYFKIIILLESYKHFLPTSEQPDKRVRLPSTSRWGFTSSFIKFECGFHTSISRPYSRHENGKCKPAYEIRQGKSDVPLYWVRDSLWVRGCNWSCVIYGCHRIKEKVQTSTYLQSVWVWLKLSFKTRPVLGSVFRWAGCGE